MIDLKRVFIKGGILSPSELKQIINYAEALGLNAIHFGSRQDIIIPEHLDNAEVDDQYPKLTTSMISDIHYQNIVSSYVAADIFPSTNWLSSATYLYILEEFKFTPRLKINIVDPKQQLVPLFNGQLNFIASDHEDYWYLQIRLSNWEKPVYYPVLIFSWDIASISKVIEDVYLEVDNVDDLFAEVNNKLETNSRTVESELKVDFKPFPYYEGMNKMGINQYWLGLYWRNNSYYLDFLREFCDFCLENRVAKICITPWKSFIVKGIPKESKVMLEKLLGKSGINIRHSLLELNWHLPVSDPEALALKQFIVRDFDQNDISTYGLTFAISSRNESNIYFTSIVIEKNESPSLVKDFKVRSTYNVLYCENFDPNTQKYNVYAQDVDKIELSGLLMELSKMYFEQLTNEIDQKKEENKAQKQPEKQEVYQCSNCLTIYDDYLGDERADIEPYTLFKNLDSNYKCDVCDSAKSSFVKVVL